MANSTGNLTWDPSTRTFKRSGAQLVPLAKSGPAGAPEDSQSPDPVNPEPTPDANPVTPYRAPESPYAGLEQDLLDSVRKGMSGPSDGVQAMIRQGNESVAQRARQVEGVAGARAAKSGALGQGTTATLADDVNRDILSTLSENVRANTALVSDENQQFLTQGQQLLQTGNQKQSSYENALASLSASNPVLAAKFTDYIMSGGSGAIGAFTPEEQAQLAEWTAQNQEISDLTLEELKAKLNQVRRGDGGSEQSGTIEAALGTNDISSLSDANLKALVTDPTYAQQALDAGLITEYTPRSIGVGKNLGASGGRTSSEMKANAAESYRDQAGLTPGQVIYVNGNYYRVDAVGERGKNKSSWGNTRGVLVTKAINLQTGKMEDILPSNYFDVD